MLSCILNFSAPVASPSRRQLTLDYRLGSPVIPAALAGSNFAPDQGTSGGQRVGVRAFIGYGNTPSDQTVLEVAPEDDIYDFHTGKYFEHYACVRWLTEEWEVTGGVRNLFDKEPPTISAGYYNRVGNAPLYSGYDYFGREVFFRIAKQF